MRRRSLLRRCAGKFWQGLRDTRSEAKPKRGEAAPEAPEEPVIGAAVPEIAVGTQEAPAIRAGAPEEPAAGELPEAVQAPVIRAEAPGVQALVREPVRMKT